ncbi:G kinase-anchoring protein 1-like [Liolophura sinensis]|uniref:G kinase-anchoring protein 1-like n=1 Tax=Liolophura sinensis TaxID=3198878 RepID=UPI003159033D
MASKISVQKSRFALLKIEDSEEGDALSSKEIQKTAQQQSGGSRKKNNKKKRADVQSDNAELKHLAFGQPVSKQKQGAGSKKNKEDSKDQWEEWKKLDTEFTADAFEKDLQQALLSSKLEYEQQSQGKKKQPMNGTVKANGDEKEEKKKKNKSKPVPMTLEQFNQLETAQIKSLNSDEEDESPAPPPPPQTRVPDNQADPRFFDRVQADVDRILTQEKMQAEYKKQYAMESVIVRKYENDVRKKDKEITMLRATVKKLEEELKQVKQRNKQLCHILGQGEMKDKAEVLLQIDELLQVKDELTEQVTLLTADLEKERSKVHGLKSELDRMKGSKHGGK